MQSLFLEKNLFFLSYLPRMRISFVKNRDRERERVKNVFVKEEESLVKRVWMDGFDERNTPLSFTFPFYFRSLKAPHNCSTTFSHFKVQ